MQTVHVNSGIMSLVTITYVFTSYNPRLFKMQCNKEPTRSIESQDYVSVIRAILHVDPLKKTTKTTSNSLNFITRTRNYNISRSGYLLKFHRILRLPRKVTLQPHQMLLLPRKMMRIIDCRRI